MQIETPLVWLRLVPRLLLLQEYFERMVKQAERFGQPVAALLGSIEAQIQLGLPSIGGKDSMSGTFEGVPPTRDLPFRGGDSR